MRGKRMSHEWPYKVNNYFDLIEISSLITINSTPQEAQSEILKSAMNVFQAESSQFCLHDPDDSSPEKERTALINLSWKYTEQYIKYYHEIDPFINLPPRINVCRETDVMPQQTWRNHEFYYDFIQPQKIRHLLVIHLQSVDKTIGHIGLHRYDSGKAFSQKDLLKANILSALISRNMVHQQLMQVYYLLFANRTRETRAAGQTPFQNNEKLTSREDEIARYICQGLTNKEISHRLCISLPTVATHVQHIFQKLGVNSRTKLVHHVSQK